MDIDRRQTLVNALLRVMPGWSQYTKYAHWGPSIRRDADGVCVDIGGGDYDTKNRLTASFDWPRDASGAMHHASEWELRDAGNPTTKITVADSTGPEGFAKAIERRLLTPQGVALFLKKVAEAKSSDDYRDRTAATVATLIAATGGHVSPHDSDKATVYTSGNLPGVYKIRASNKDVSLELNVTLDVALKVLEVVKSMKREVA